jgi:hypothetical protein
MALDYMNAAIAAGTDRAGMALASNTRTKVAGTNAAAGAITMVASGSTIGVIANGATDHEPDAGPIVTQYTRPPQLAALSYGCNLEFLPVREANQQKVLPMFTSKQYRAKAAKYAELLKAAIHPNEIREFQRLRRSFTDLADNEQWLTDNYDRTVHSPVEKPTELRKHRVLMC